VVVNRSVRESRPVLSQRLQQGTVDSTRLSVIRVTGPETDTAMPEERPAIGTATHRTPSSCSCSFDGVSGRSNPLELRVGAERD